jgi:hypothetical protein
MTRADAYAKSVPFVDPRMKPPLILKSWSGAFTYEPVEMNA